MMRTTAQVYQAEKFVDLTEEVDFQASINPLSIASLELQVNIQASL